MTDYNISIAIKQPNKSFFEGNKTLNIIGLGAMLLGFIILFAGAAFQDIIDEIFNISMIAGFGIILIAFLLIGINTKISNKKIRKKLIHGKAILSNLNNNLICIFTSEYGETIIFNLGDVITRGSQSNYYERGIAKKLEIHNFNTQIEFNGQIMNCSLLVMSNNDKFISKMYELGLVEEPEDDDSISDD